MNFPRRRGGSHVTNHPPHVTRGARRSAALPNLRRGGGFFGHDPPTSLFLTRPAVSPHRMATARRGPHDLEQRPQRVHLRRHQPTTAPYTTYQLPPSNRDRAIDARSSMGRGGKATYGHDGPERKQAQRVSRGRVPPRRDDHRVQRRPSRYNTPKRGCHKGPGITWGQFENRGRELHTTKGGEMRGRGIGMGFFGFGNGNNRPDLLVKQQHRGESTDWLRSAACS